MRKARVSNLFYQIHDAPTLYLSLQEEIPNNEFMHFFKVRYVLRGVFSFWENINFLQMYKNDQNFDYTFNSTF